MQGKIISYFLIVFSLTCSVSFSDDNLKNILKSTNVKVIIEDPAKQETEAAKYTRMIKELKTKTKNQQESDPLLSGLKIKNRIEKGEGVPFERSSSLLSLNPESQEIFSDNSPLSPCSEALIIKRPGKDKKDEKVWLDSLYLYENDLPKQKSIGDTYGLNVTLFPISAKTSPYIIQTVRAEGGRCLPFRHMIIGDTDIKMYGAAALVKR